MYVVCILNNSKRQKKYIVTQKLDIFSFHFTQIKLRISEINNSANILALLGKASKKKNESVIMIIPGRGRGGGVRG